MSALTQRVGTAVSLAVIGLLALATAAQAVSTEVTVLNSSGRTLRVVNSHLDHGRFYGTGPAGTAAPGGTIHWYAAQDGYATGDEGWVDVATEGTNEGHFHFSFDNPFIGSNSYNTSADGPFAIYRWGPGTGVGDQAKIGYEIVRIRQEYPRVLVPAGGPGQVSGQVRWKAAEGQPSGTQPWQAMTLSALVPRSFQPLDPAFAPANVTSYNGQQGTFSDLQPTGYFQARPAQSLPPGTFGFDYTISSLVANVPVQLKATVLDNVSWPPAPGNAAPVGLLYPKYVRGIVSSGAAFTLWPEAPVRPGVDLEVAGGWVSDPPGGSGQGSAGADVMALIARSKTVAINPNPVLSARLRARVLQRANTQRIQEVNRVWALPGEIIAAPSLQLQKGTVRQYNK